jgi:hypothetical protein
MHMGLFCYPYGMIELSIGMPILAVAALAVRIMTKIMGLDLVRFLGTIC